MQTNSEPFGMRGEEREREGDGGCWARTRLDKHRGKLRAVDLNRFDPFNDATSEIYGAANRNVNPDMKWGPRERGTSCVLRLLSWKLEQLARRDLSWVFNKKNSTNQSSKKRNKC